MAFSFYENDDEFRQAMAEIARFNDEYIKSLESRDFNEVLQDLFGFGGANNIDCIIGIYSIGGIDGVVPDNAAPGTEETYFVKALNPDRRRLRVEFLQ